MQPEYAHAITDVASVPNGITPYQWLVIGAFMVAQAVGVTWLFARTIRRIEIDGAAKRDEDRKEHDERHKQIWSGMNKVQDALRNEIAEVKERHEKDVRDLSVDIAARPDWTRFEMSMEKLENRMVAQLKSIYDLVKEKFNGGR